MTDNNVDAYYILENLFVVTDILEDKEYDLKDWRNIRWIVSKLNRVTGNAIRLHHQNQQLKKEKELLEAQLYCTDESGVCGICDNEYLEPVKSSPYGYYISKCKNGHDECSKSTLKYCSDFKLKNKRLNGGV